MALAEAVDALLRDVGHFADDIQTQPQLDLVRVSRSLRLIMVDVARVATVAGLRLGTVGKFAGVP